METLPITANKEEIKNLVVEWLELLAKESKTVNRQRA